MVCGAPVGFCVCVKPNPVKLRCGRCGEFEDRCTCKYIEPGGVIYVKDLSSAQKIEARGWVLIKKVNGVRSVIVESLRTEKVNLLEALLKVEDRSIVDGFAPVLITAFLDGKVIIDRASERTEDEAVAFKRGLLTENEKDK